MTPVASALDVGMHEGDVVTVVRRWPTRDSPNGAL